MSGTRIVCWAVLGLTFATSKNGLLADEPTKKLPPPPLISRDRDPEFLPRILGDNEPELIVPLPRVAAYTDGDLLEQYWIAHRLGSSPGSLMIVVGLFNHGSRPLEIEVDGRPIVLSPKKNLTITAPREFLWRAKNSPSRTVVVPKDAVGVELVFPKEQR